MNLGCLASVGALFLALGIATLFFERLRQRRAGNRPYQYSDLTTALIPDNEDPDATPVQPRPISASRRFQLPATAPQVPHLHTILSNLLRKESTQVASNPATSANQNQSRGRVRGPIKRGALILAGASTLLFALAVVAAIATTGNPQVQAKSSIVIGVEGFQRLEPGPDLRTSLANFISKSAAESGRGDVVIALSTSSPSTVEQAEAERARLQADFLIWGEVGPTGAITATLIFAPDFRVGQQIWQRNTDVDTAALIFPQEARVFLTSDSGTDPLVPLVIALAHLRAGNYTAAAGAAAGAQATLDEGNGSGQIARFVQATANIAAGNAKPAVTLFNKIEAAGEVWPEEIINKGIAQLEVSDWSGAREEAERAIARRETSDRALSRANLIRARSRYRQSIDLTQAASDLDEALRLDPAYADTKLDKAEVLYRQSQPDAARTELEGLLARMRDNAAAYRLTGLVRLMLAQPDDAQNALQNAERLYSGWIAALRTEEGRAQVAGEAAQAEAATKGILLLNRELAGVYLYQGMAWADKAQKEPPETFFGGVWRNIRGEPTLYERAIGKMQEAARLAPNRADIPVQLGSLYVRMGDTARGAQALATAREIDPTAPEPYLALAHLQEAQHNTSEAVKTITELTTNSQRYYPAYEELYRLYSAAGDAASARASLQRALQIAPQEAGDHLWHGKFLQFLGNPGEAEKEFRAALSNPDLWEAHVHLGELLTEAGRHPEALAEFQAALNIQPNDPDALLGAAKLMVLAGQVEDAKALFGRLTSLAPQNVNGHLSYSQLLLGQGDIQGAVEQAKQAVASGQGRDDAHFYLGLAYEAQQDWKDAGDEFRTAVTLNPSYFEAWVRLARALNFQDRYADVLEAAKKAGALRAGDPQPYRWEASAQFALGDAQAAVASLNEALKLNPQYVEALALASKVYATQGDTATALALAARATEADPRNPSGLLAAGEAYLKQSDASSAQKAYEGAYATGLQKADALAGEGRAALILGDYPRAIKSFGDALAVDPNYADASLYAGDAYAQLGNWDEALRQYNRSVQLRPTWAQALYGQGRALLQRGDADGALGSFEKAVSSLPDYAEAWAARGIVLRNKGQQQDALAALEHAIQINPLYSDAWLTLGLTYEELGDRSRALQAFTKASNTATTAATKQQAESGAQRVK